MKGDEFDPKGLIFEAYRIDGITKMNVEQSFWIGRLASRLRRIKSR